MGNLSNEQLAALGISLGIVFIAIFVVWVLEVIAGWKIFQKAGEPGWKSIIPIYSSYISYKIAWNGMMFWITLAIGIVYNLLIKGEPGFMTIAAGAIMIVNIILYCMYNGKMAKAFGKGTGFAVGLVFLNPIFKLILGFGNARYEGPQA
ncbi:MAG: DUF5684 domain-containing protein [Anaerostipes sp.]|jgi:hypothetical protein|nr:DUF5684 domain-containing protein [Anaerostipes sp.]MDD3747262.1 DUF5684 domain-containing protein [Anaerostipes sp.]